MSIGDYFPVTAGVWTKVYEMMNDAANNKGAFPIDGVEQGFLIPRIQATPGSLDIRINVERHVTKERDSFCATLLKASCNAIIFWLAAIIATVATPIFIGLDLLYLAGSKGLELLSSCCCPRTENKQIV